jgi:hypothetical protein
MLAGRHSEVEVLNHLARTRMQAENLLTGPVLETRMGMTLQAGDRIVVRTNWYAHCDLRNGQTGTVTAVDPETGQLAFKRDRDGGDVVLPKRYVDQSVDYGYAQTIHTAQGHTYDQAHVYVDHTMTAEHGYTGLSRASGPTHLWTADPPGPLGDCAHSHCPAFVEDRTDTLVRQLSRSGVRPSAAEHYPPVELLSDRELLDRRNELSDLISQSPLAQPRPDIEGLDIPIAEAQAVADRLGTSGARHQLDMLQREREWAVEANTRRERWIDDHLFGEYTDIREEIDRRVSARTVLWQINPPEDLLEQVGSRSESPDPLAWDAAVAVYAKTRLEVGPDVDLLDPAVRQAGHWHDLVLKPIETPSATLRLTG